MLMNTNSFYISSVQVVMFAPALPELRFRTSEVLASILPRFANRFDGEIESTPTPSQPNELGPIGPGTQLNFRIVTPSVVLRSADGQWTFNALPRRTESSWTRPRGEMSQDSLTKVCQECLAPLLAYPVERKTQIGRLALVVHRIMNADNPPHAIASQFCRHELVDENNASAPLRHSRNFRLDNFKKYAYPIDGRQVNSWVRCRSDHIDGLNVVKVEQDLNTLQEDEASTAFDVKDIEQFFNWASDELNKIMSLYFPA